MKNTLSFAFACPDPALADSLTRAAAGRLPQTVLLSGEDSDALAAVSLSLAAAIVCMGTGEKPCGVCPACRKMLAGVHPDCTVIDEGEDELKVDLARRLKSLAAIIPNDGAHSVFILRHAQNLNPAAQNALLKVLEEPPAHAFFILTAEKPNVLLETVRSRCLKFSLSPAAEAAPAQDPAALAPYLAALAEGNEFAMLLAAQALEKAPRKTMISLLATLQSALRDAVFVSLALPQAPLCPALQTESTALGRRLPPERLLRLSDFTHTLADRLQRNAAAAAVSCALSAEVYTLCFR